MQLALAASVDPQALAPVETAKSLGLVPAIVIPDMFSVALPVFESVAAKADEVVAAVVLGKASEGVSVAAGVGAAVPVPVRVEL